MSPDQLRETQTSPQTLTVCERAKGRIHEQPIASISPMVCSELEAKQQQKRVAEPLRSMIRRGRTSCWRLARTLALRGAARKEADARSAGAHAQPVEINDFRAGAGRARRTVVTRTAGSKTICGELSFGAAGRRTLERERRGCLEVGALSLLQRNHVGVN